MAKFYPNIIQLPHYGITLSGKIRDTEYPGLMIPEIKLLLDAQAKPNFETEFILITHTHSDRCVSLPLKMDNQVKPLIVSPQETVYSLVDYVNALSKFKYSVFRSDKISVNPKFIGASYGDHVSLKNNMYVKVYDLDHTIPCCGYGLNVIRTVLKKEHIGINRKEILKLRKEGVCLTQIIHEPILVFISETTISVFDQYPELYDYPIIVLECTYLPINSNDVDEELQQAIDNKQIHWTQLYPIVQNHTKNTFVLYNFSQKYSNDEINIFKSSITDTNIIFIM